MMRKYRQKLTVPGKSWRIVRAKKKNTVRGGGGMVSGPLYKCSLTEENQFFMHLLRQDSCTKPTLLTDGFTLSIFQLVILAVTSPYDFSHRHLKFS